MDVAAHVAPELGHDDRWSFDIQCLCVGEPHAIPAHQMRFIRRVELKIFMQGKQVLRVAHKGSQQTVKASRFYIRRFRIADAKVGQNQLDARRAAEFHQFNAPRHQLVNVGAARRLIQCLGIDVRALCPEHAFHKTLRRMGQMRLLIALEVGTVYHAHGRVILCNLNG
jgi:hypothetical protein